MLFGLFFMDSDYVFLIGTFVAMVFFGLSYEFYLMGKKHHEIARQIMSEILTSEVLADWDERGV